MWRLMVAFLAMTGSAVAQDWATRNGDLVLSSAQMQQKVVGHSLTFYDNGVSEYLADGRYSYTYDGGNTAWGVYELGADGTVCTQFQNGFSRCDMFVQNGERLVVITEKGERYPIRLAEAN